MLFSVKFNMLIYMSINKAKFSISINCKHHYFDFQKVFTMWILNSIILRMSIPKTGRILSTAESNDVTYEA